MSEAVAPPPAPATAPVLDPLSRNGHYFPVVAEPEMQAGIAGRPWPTGRARLFMWLALVRVCAVLLVAEFTGMAHAGIDLLESLGGIEHHDADDCDDGPGHECPPGCPNCHCWHGAPGLTATPRLEELQRTLFPSTSPRVSTAPYAGRQPAGADPNSPYRPPRPRLS